MMQLFKRTHWEALRSVGLLLAVAVLGWLTARYLVPSPLATGGERASAANARPASSVTGSASLRGALETGPHGDEPAFPSASNGAGGSTALPVPGLSTGAAGSPGSNGMVAPVGPGNGMAAPFSRGSDALAGAWPVPGVNGGAATSPSTSALPGGSSPMPGALAELMSRQAELSRQGPAPRGDTGGTGGTGVPGAADPGLPLGPGVPRGAVLDSQRQAILDLQAQAMAEIRAVRPGETQKLIKAMENFDARMRQAGAPPLIDMDGLRKTLYAADRIQTLNQALVSEVNRGRDADPQKLQSLSDQLATAQKALTNHIVKPEVLSGLLKP